MLGKLHLVPAVRNIGRIIYAIIGQSPFRDDIYFPIQSVLIGKSKSWY